MISEKEWNKPCTNEQRHAFLLVILVIGKIDMVHRNYVKEKIGIAFDARSVGDLLGGLDEMNQQKFWSLLGGEPS